MSRVDCLHTLRLRRRRRKQPARWLKGEARHLGRQPLRQPLVGFEQQLEVRSFGQDDVDVARQTERRTDPGLELRGRRDRPQAIERRDDADARRQRRGAIVNSTAPTRIARRRRKIQSASRGITSSGTRRFGGRRGRNAGTMINVRMPHIIMLWPSSRPRCCRFGESTNIKP